MCVARDGPADITRHIQRIWQNYKYMNYSKRLAAMFAAAGLLLLFVLRLSPGESQEQPPDAGLASPSPITGALGQDTTSNVLSAASNRTVFNQSRDLWAINYGKEGIAFFWAKEPSKTTRIIIYRQNPATNKWEVAINAPVGPDLRRDLVDAIDGTQRDFVYRMDALSSSNRILKHYQPVLIPKYVPN
jgi:hypothetical protein